MRKAFGAALAALLAAACLAPVAESGTGAHVPSPRFLSPHGQDVETFQLAGNPRGDAAVAWVEARRRHRPRLWLRTRHHGHAFGLPAVISGAASSESLAVAVGDDGSVVVAWIELRRPRPRVVVLARRGYGSFAKRVLASSAHPYALAAALAPDGTAMAAWVKGSRRGPEQLHAALRTADGRWSHSHTVTHGKWDVASPQVAFDARGDATLAWERRPPRGEGEIFFEEGPPNQVAVVERPARGPFGRPHVVSRRAYDASEPALGENARGDAVVAWDSIVGAFKGFRIGYVTRPAGKGFAHARWLTARHGFAVSPRVSVSSGGRVDVAWTHARARRGRLCDDCSAVRMAHGRPGGALAHRRWVSPRRSRLDVMAANPSGEKLLVWDVQNRGEFESNHLEGRFVARGGGLRSRRRLSKTGLNFDTEALLASNGHGLVAWIAEGRERSRIAFVHMSEPSK